MHFLCSVASNKPLCLISDDRGLPQTTDRRNRPARVGEAAWTSEPKTLFLLPVPQISEARPELQHMVAIAVMAVVVVVCGCFFLVKLKLGLWLGGAWRCIPKIGFRVSPKIRSRSSGR